MKVTEKPAAFYPVFERKGGPARRATHYCPGCGHGNIHKLIAEALDELGVAERTVLISPVGCSVFAYYYFDCGNVQCAHGRAPAVATGIKRANPDSIVISYQGDGDLAAIGTAETVHAANRGEGITVFFVNNAIYGMTGGQMAPTTLLQQKTTTTPLGRQETYHGNPIRVCELLATLPAPTYIERVAIGTTKHIMKARKAIHKALRNQVEGRGYSFVEILSPCPTGWKMDPPDAREWMLSEMTKFFPLGVFKDESDAREGAWFRHVDPFAPERVTRYFGSEPQGAKGAAESLPLARDLNCKFAGFGGQGILSLGLFLAEVGMRAGHQVSWIPSYGPEMRGGTANCTVIVADEEIGSPLVRHPQGGVIFNLPSLDKYESTLLPGGVLVANASLINRPLRRDDLQAVLIPANEIAESLGNKRLVNVIMVGALLAKLPVLPLQAVEKALENHLPERHRKLLPLNLQALRQGAAFARGELATISR
jgi:2-oxoisovalerate ferredoxin oxidoreductase beta subunit